MKIAILTQSEGIYASKRLLQACLTLGHDCKLVPISDVVLEVGGLTEEQKSDNGIYTTGEKLTDYDLVIIRGIFSSSKRTIAIIKYLRSLGIKVMDNNLEVVGYNIDKVRDSVLFYVNDLPYPKTINVLDEDDFREGCNDLGYPVIVKHYGSGMGMGVYKLDDISDVDDFIEKVKEKENHLKAYLIQEFIEYEKDLRIFVINGKVIGAMQRIPKKGDFKANFSQGGSVKAIEIDEETKELAKKAAKTTQATNAGVDVLIKYDGTKYILEVNRNPGFKGFEKATGIDIATLIIEESIKNAK